MAVVVFCSINTNFYNRELVIVLKTISKYKIENSIKSQRVKELSKVTTTLEEKFIKNMINKNTEVLYEKQLDKNLYEGHSSNYIKVITESEKDLENKIFNVILEENRGLYAISGKI